MSCLVDVFNLCDMEDLGYKGMLSLGPTIKQMINLLLSGLTDFLLIGGGELDFLVFLTFICLDSSLTIALFF